MIEEFRVSNPKDDERMVNMQSSNFDRQYQGLINELPLPEMKRQQDKAMKNKRGVMKSTLNQSVNSLIADQVRHIYDNRNHPM